MPASSMVPHTKTLLMCDVAYVNKEGIGAKVPARLSLEASYPTVPLLSHPCSTNSLPTETKDPREIPKRCRGSPYRLAAPLGRSSLGEAKPPKRSKPTTSRTPSTTQAPAGVLTLQTPNVHMDIS
ncbi:hypothetical protein ILYODFUR_024500 [Ilyodon furcidens]|uniref:Uncharacterized protein n=1 Tax=Ilyodon furcidens TaxID=33524 RepID=A0ABV0V8D5_9TELE